MEDLGFYQLLSKIGRKSSGQVCWLQSAWLLISVEVMVPLGWLAKLWTAAYSLSHVLRCGQECEEVGLCLRANYMILFIQVSASTSSSTAVYVNAVVRIANLKCAGSRSGPQERELRPGGMESLGDDEYHAILGQLSSIV